MIKSKLNDISKPVKTELETFQKIFKSSLKSSNNLVDLVTNYIIKQKGKKVRPVLVLLSAQVCGEINERSYRGATLVELLHTATLVHDDVVDSADKRRGFPSINAIWKNKIAVLMGDYLLAKGLMISVEGEDFDFLKKITNTVRRMSEGELLQIQKTRKLDIDEETYFKIISDKTASLIETCCEIGSMSSSNNPEHHQALKNFGNYLGLAFQIKDDILDYEGTAKLFGKPIGGDIKEKKITLPLIYALNKVALVEANRVRKLIKNNSKKDSVKEVIEFVKKNNGIEYSQKVAFDLGEKAKNCLAIFQDSQAKQSLESLVDFVLERNN